MSTRQHIAEPVRRDVYRGLVRVVRYQTSRDGDGFDDDNRPLGKWTSEDATAHAILTASDDDGGAT